MKNPDYHPDTAHLPSHADMIRWRFGGGWQKDKYERDKLKRVREKWDRVHSERAALLLALEINVLQDQQKS